MSKFESQYKNYYQNGQNNKYLNRFKIDSVENYNIINRINNTSTPIVDVFKTEQKVNFIINSILAIYDKDQDKNKKTDGKIDLAEFRSVKKEDYEKYVKEIKAYYKQICNEDLNYHIPTYSELEQMLVENGQFDAEKSVITYDEIADPIFADGVVMQSNQMATGECYQDASNIALSLTTKGRQLLQKSVSFNKSTDTYTVTLYGAKQKDGKPFVFKMAASDLTKAQEERIDQIIHGELKKNQKRYATGSATVVLFDKAIEAYRKSIGYSLRARDKKENKGYDDYLSGGHPEKNIELITGCKSQALIMNNELSDEVDSDNIQSFHKWTRSHSMKKLSDAFNHKNSEKRACLLSYAHKLNSTVAMTCSFTRDVGNNEKLGKARIVTSHAYAVKSIGFDYVELINPWDGAAKPVKITMNDFLTYVRECHINNLE